MTTLEPCRKGSGRKNSDPQPKLLRDLPLGWRFALVICGVVLMMGLVSIFFMGSRLNNALHAEHQERAMTIARNLAEDCADLLLTDNRIKLHQLLANIKTTEKDVEYIYVLDAKKNIVAHTFGEKGFPRVLLNTNPLHPGVQSSKALLKFDTDDYIIHELAIPVMAGEAGEIHLGFSRAFIQQKIRNLRQELAGITILTCLLGILAGLLFARIINKPLMALAIASDKVGKGEPIHDLPIAAHDEIGRLTATFNQMVANIKESRATQLKAEERLAASYALLNSLINSIPDIITLQDKNMNIVLVNKAACDFFEMEQEDFTGKKCHEIFRDIATLCDSCPLVKSFHDRLPHAETIEHEKLGKTFHVSTAPVFDHNDEVQYITHIARDITVQKKLEEDLFQAHKMEAIGTLAGGIAHDFNNILTAIIGHAELAKFKIPDNCGAETNIVEVLKSSRRAADLVKQILSFSRKSGSQVHPVSPHLPVKEALKMLHASLPATVTIQEDIDHDCGQIKADPTNIHQIVVNLCTNAVHALKDEKGVLTVRLKRKEIGAAEIRGETDVSPGPFVVLSVEDTGCGIDENTLRRIFEPYFTTKEAGKGTGLGLSVVHGIVKNYNGFCKVESKVGKGSSFHIHFPVSGEALPRSEETQKGEVLPVGTERLLVVDDERTIVALQKEVLEGLGYKVTGTTDSTEALAALRSNPAQFDLIITDQTMPVLTGAELAKEVMKIRPAMPVILCTGYSSTISKEEMLAAGIRKYVEKPVAVHELAHMVRTVLDGD